MRMPAITLWQPWASLLFVDLPLRKQHETRTFALPQKYLGERIAIHAAKQWPADRHLSEDLLDLCDRAFGPRIDQLPRGAVIGWVRFDQWCVTPIAQPASEADAIAGDWGPGRYAWHVDESQLLSTPVPAVGRQGWFSVELSDEAVAV